MRTDNRWSPGASGATLPEYAPAMYSARWIDRGQMMPADILPDRQGFAYDDTAERDRMLTRLVQCAPHCSIGALDYDTPTRIVWPQLEVWLRRAGGYVYVDAWSTDGLTP